MNLSLLCIEFMSICLTLFNILNVILFYFLIIVFTEIIFLAHFFVVLFFEAVSLVAEAELKLMAVSLPYSPEC